MVIYVDILFLTNAMIGYCLLKSTQLLCGTKAPVWRMGVTTLAAGAFSLLLLLPPMPFWLHLCINFSCYAAMFIILCVPCKMRLYLRHMLLYATQNMLVCGLIYAICFYTGTKRFAVNNGAVYIQATPLLLVGSALAVYLLLSLAQLLLGRTVPTLDYPYTVDIRGSVVCGTAFLDTGFTTHDIFHDCPVVLLDFHAVQLQLHTDLQKAVEDYFLTQQLTNGIPLFLLPMHTMAGQVLAPCLRAGKITIAVGGKKDVCISSVTVAFSAMALAEAQNALIGKDIFNQL